MQRKDAMKKVRNHWLKAICKKIRSILTDKSGCIRNIPKKEMESIAKMLLPDIVAFFETEEGKRVFAEWQKHREENRAADVA